MPSYQTLFDLAILLIGALASLVRKGDLDKIRILNELIHNGQIRHEELEKTVDKHRESAVDSTHNIRTLIGTDYVTKTEHTRAIDSINHTMREGFKSVGGEFRQILKDLKLIN